MNAVARAKLAKPRAVDSAHAPPVSSWLEAFLSRPQPIERVELVRVLLPIWILGFMSSRLVHADYWLGQRGFHVPDLHGDWRQPLYLSPLSNGAAWAVAALTVIAGLMVCAGIRTRYACALFAALLAYLALADRLEEFTVSKISPVLIAALVFSHAGSRYGIDAWLRSRGAERTSSPGPSHAPAGAVRFFQLFLATFYCASGIAKLRGNWVTADVLWSHLHDSYQTATCHFLAMHLPVWAWQVFQRITLVFEVGAPLWFALPWTRPIALIIGLGLHLMIGLMFGPVVWFALLMATLLIASYAKFPWRRAPR